MDAEMDNFPKESESQRLGQLAKKALEATCPLCWRFHWLDGDDDVGLDAQVQVVLEDKYKYIFRMQLKGSISKSPNISDDTFSIPLKGTTLNYYSNITEPIMLVFCDLSVDSDPRKCPLYYEWVHPLIKTKLADEPYFPGSQKEYTFHVRKSNKLDASTDVVPDISHHLKRHRVLDSMYSSLEASRPEISIEPIEAISKFTDKIRQTGGRYLTSFLDDSTEPWPHADPQTIAGKLYEVNQYIKRNLLDDASYYLSTIMGLVRSICKSSS